MGASKTPRTDALFGIFLQDVREIRQKHIQSVGSTYYRFDYESGEEDGYSLSIVPDNLPKDIRKEVLQAFDGRLNRDPRHLRGRIRKKNKGAQF